MMKSLDIYIAIFLIFYGKSATSSPLCLSDELIENILKSYFLNDSQLDCIKDIIKQEVNCGNFFTLIHGNNHGDRLIHQLSTNHCYNFIVRSPKSQKWLLRSKAYIILLNNITECAEVFDKLSKDFAWTPRAKFFIILNFNHEEYLKVFTVLSKLNIYYVYLINTAARDEIYVYTYNPFINNTCGDVNKKIVKTFSCKEIKKNEIHLNDIEDQIRNCPISVLAVENPPNVILKSNKYIHNHRSNLTGIEQHMLNNIAEIENYNLKYIETKQKYQHEFLMDNCTTNSALGYLGNHPLGISIRGYVLTKKRSECYDYIWGYCYGNFNVYTTLPKVEHWRKVYQVFGTTTWVLITLSYCAVAGTSIIIYNMSVGKVNKSYIAFKIWGYLNSISDQQLIKIRKLKIITIIWIWFAFFVTSFYGTAFFGLLTTPDEKVPSLSPDKLFSSSLEPCINFNVRAWFKSTYNLTFNNTGITRLDDECLHQETALAAVVKNDDLYTVVIDPTFYKREYKYLDSLGHPKLKRSFFGTGDFLFSVFVNKGFPLLDKFQRYAFYHFESGLLLKHIDDTYHQFVVVTEFNPFTLQDFRIHFAVLFMGYFISLIIYIVEINQVR